jgi:hypothetical protein
MKALRPEALLGCVLVCAFGCSSQPGASPLPDQRPGDGGASASTDGRAKETGAAEAGAADGEAGDGAPAERDGGGPDVAAEASGDLPEPADMEAGDEGGFTGPPRPAPLCNVDAGWGPGARLDVSTAQDDALDAITPDEQTVAWSVGAGPTMTIDYADRASIADPFGAPLTLPGGTYLADSAALSPDGLRLVVVNQDGQGFSEWTRTVRAAAFGSPGAGTYSNLDAPGALATGERYGDPVLSADDRAFYYSVYGGGRTATIVRTARLFAGDPWPSGFSIPAATDLQAQGALRRKPTGISSDQQTLFFWDEVASAERAGWLDDATGAFDVFVTLGPLADAAPDLDCARLYYSASGASSVDLFVGSR